ncbi:GNAT family N-acetyltransferase [Pelagovum pacificum]|uniref:GNAT family N-acetyltransferase n=1 Tax=Pelagovum pacificum TaxID=2588711 RepID=A0A5C5G9K5_9RHOB|nr:GNAT family N-acetyltransferase [Pelagovum pacificum]QQA41821.1 GNAT family N-acetyltransferase [Pelagovum pacificum]TNY30735.1 GNAT family N-acetyltransferase [Pelagovum pacificum]
MSEIILRPYTPDDAAWLVERHADLYARDEGFDGTFGPLVAGLLADFSAHADPEREAGWIAMQDGAPIGSIFCVSGSPGSAKLRLFLIVPEARGQGLGHMLLDQCMSFAGDAGYRRMELWTHESHRAACALYAKFGWRLVDSHPVTSFGVDLIEQSWEIDL